MAIPPARSLLLLLPVWVLSAPAADAGDLTSASYRMRGAHESAVAARALPSAGPRYSGSGVALGQGDALGFAGGASTLTTAAPGFWPIAAGDLPNHDVDGDGEASWLDPDDDGDGLADAIERNTGVFVSAADPGTSAVLADTDGDGFDDGVEVDAGSDPNDPESTPPPGEVPLAPNALYPLVALAMALVARARLRIGRRPSC